MRERIVARPSNVPTARSANGRQSPKPRAQHSIAGAVHSQSALALQDATHRNPKPRFPRRTPSNPAFRGLLVGIIHAFSLLAAELPLRHR
jgi:hypothetical protein